MNPIPHKNFLQVEQLCDPVAVPISANRGDQFQHCGMGMLLSVGSNVFLVTCRHIIVNAAKDNLQLWVRDAAFGKLRRVSADFFLSSLPELDIAVAKLSSELAADLSANRLLTLTDFSDSHQPLGIPCVMHGILAELSSKWDFAVKTTDIRLKPASFIGRTTDSQNVDDVVDDEIHFILYASNRFSASVSKEKMELAELNATFRGLSGTPVIAVDGDPFKEDWNPVDTKIIGIQSGVVKFEESPNPDGCHEYMKIVRIEFLYYLLHESFPDDFKRLKA